MVQRTRRTYRKTYLREWRKHRGATLARLVEMLAQMGHDTTEATLSRVEKGLQPYSQPLIEAIAEVLRCSPTDLIDHPPGLGDDRQREYPRHGNKGREPQTERPTLAAKCVICAVHSGGCETNHSDGYQDGHGRFSVWAPHAASESPL